MNRKNLALALKTASGDTFGDQSENQFDAVCLSQTAPEAIDSSASNLPRVAISQLFPDGVVKLASRKLRSLTDPLHTTHVRPQRFGNYHTAILLLIIFQYRDQRAADR